MLKIECPKCGSNDIRSSLSQSFVEEIKKIFGFFPLRCKVCDTRFSRQIWDAANAIYAKCPRCYRLDLTTWSTHYYHCSARWHLLMKIGWRRHRCEYCRHNFLDFRPAKLKYARRKEAYPE